MEKITFTVEGLMCPKCEARANEAVKSAAKVEKVTSSHETGETVVIAQSGTDENAITSAIESHGYKVTAVKREEYEKRGFFSRFKK